MVDKLFSNPYASALDGLQLEDPVSAFFSFCKERENIRLNREKGRPFHGQMILFFNVVDF